MMANMIPVSSKAFLTEIVLKLLLAVAFMQLDCIDFFIVSLYNSQQRCDEQVQLK